MAADVISVSPIETCSPGSHRQRRQAITDFRIDKAGNVLRGKAYASFPHLAEQSSVAASDTTLAVTIPLSYGVYLIAVA